MNVKRAAWALTFVLAGIASLPACTRGKSREQGSPAPVAVAPATPVEPQAAAKDAVSAAWLAGELPKTTETPVAGGELIVGIHTNPPSLNGLIDSDLIGSWITRHRIYEGLVTLDPFDDPDYGPKPELAERWEISEDKKTYTFHLRKGVTWHDGKPFTSRDVIATMDKIQDPTSKAMHVRSAVQELARYYAPDDFTVVFVWKRPYAFTLDAFADDIEIQPAHVIAKLSGTQFNEASTNPLNRAPVGTGPFKFKTWQNNEKIELARNDAYWGDKPYLDRLTFRIVQDPTVRLQLAERGELDLVNRITSEQWQNMDQPVFKRDWNRSRFMPAQYAWIGWNAERPYFKDKRVRRALTMLADRPGIIGKMMYGLPQPTTCHFYWKSAACDPELKPLPYDPAAAGQLLDEAGWKDSDGDGVRDKGGQPFRFVFMVPPNSTEAIRWSAKIKEDLARAGIAMDLQLVEWSAFTKRLREHAFDACALIWGSGAHGEPTQIWHSSGIKGGSNYVGFNDPEADKLMEQARVEFDPAVRDALYRKLGALLYEEQPYTWMYVPAELNLLHKRVKGATPTLYWWRFERMWLDPALRRK